MDRITNSAAFAFKVSSLGSLVVAVRGKVNQIEVEQFANIFRHGSLHIGVSYIQNDELGQLAQLLRNFAGEVILRKDEDFEIS